MATLSRPGMTLLVVGWFVFGAVDAGLWSGSTGQQADAVLAQTGPPAPRFEVASVKPNKSGAQLRLDVQGGRFHTTNVPLRQLIRAAYQLQLFQILDAPGWVASDRFDVIATSDRDLTVTTPWIPGGRLSLVQLMLQSLLAERSLLVAHNETRQLPIYSLVFSNANGRPGPQLRVATGECAPRCGMQVGPGTLAARRVPLPQLAELLSQLTGRVVTDKTGSSEHYDIDLTWTPDTAPIGSDVPVDPAAPSIFTAIGEQLGLKLEPGRGPVPVLVIDSVQPPTPD